MNVPNPSVSHLVDSSEQINNYEVIKKDDAFYVFEHGNNFVIQRFEERAFAVSLKRRLSRGCGFAGFTPEFVVDKSLQEKFKLSYRHG